ncbi:DUF3445 domain-containing protein [Halopseudomonas pachastrellae]|nr:DUF3445 domain-containing protein [Halopseudomonas pachastrellae]
MPVVMKPVETYRDDFTFSNSPQAMPAFPFRFPEDSYMYSVNIEPATPREPGSVFEHWFDIDEHYVSEMAERARVLERDPQRCLMMPHMAQAAWDTLEMLMEHLAADYPSISPCSARAIDGCGSTARWASSSASPSAMPSTLPYEPLEYITRQAQGDFAVLDQRDGDLFMDAGMVTFAPNWSIKFDAGMSFKQWHAPVPGVAHQLGVFDRALKYLLNIQVGQPVRRLSWTMTINPRLDISSETFHEWGHELGLVTPENVARRCTCTSSCSSCRACRAAMRCCSASATI